MEEAAKLSKTLIKLVGNEYLDPGTPMRIGSFGVIEAILNTPPDTRMVPGVFEINGEKFAAMRATEEDFEPCEDEDPIEYREQHPWITPPTTEYGGKINKKLDAILRTNRKGEPLPILSKETIEEPTTEPKNETVAEAHRILKTGNPIEYIMKVFRRDYVGGDEYGQLLLFSALCSTCNNTMGLHPGVDGKSGEGKSFAMLTMINLLPDEYKVCGKITPNAAFYASLKDGTTLFMDDIGKMTDDLGRFIKLSTTFYQTGVENLTVVKGESVRQKTPRGLNFWLTGVDVGSFNKQILNRSVNVGLDEPNKKIRDEHKDKIFLHQLDDIESGRPALEITDDVLIAREITGHLLRLPPINVRIPFIKDETGTPLIIWTDKENSRNLPVFADMIRVSASINRYNRKTINGSLIATLEDYDIAKKMWDRVNEEQVTKLNRGDQELITALVKLNAHERDVDMYELADAMTKNYKTIYQKLFGRPNDGVEGLIERYDNLRIVEQGETEFEKTLVDEMYDAKEKKTGSIHKQRILLRLRTPVDMLNLKQSAVSINREKAQTRIDEILSPTISVISEQLLCSTFQ